MRLSVIAVGRLKTGPEKDLAAEYQKRLEALGRKSGITRVSVSEFAESQAASAAQRIAEEERQIAAAVPANAYTIVLDERGKLVTSEAFAETLRRQIDGGTADIACIIGGPDGHTEATRSRANLLLCFGAMTWPHRLVRVMLFEQLYRAATLMAGHPYHRP